MEKNCRSTCLQPIFAGIAEFSDFDEIATEMIPANHWSFNIFSLKSEKFAEVHASDPFSLKSPNFLISMKSIQKCPRVADNFTFFRQKSEILPKIMPPTHFRPKIGRKLFFSIISSTDLQLFSRRIRCQHWEIACNENWRRKSWIFAKKNRFWGQHTDLGAVVCPFHTYSNQRSVIPQVR